MRATDGDEPSLGANASAALALPNGRWVPTLRSAGDRAARRFVSTPRCPGASFTTFHILFATIDRGLLILGVYPFIPIQEGP